MVGSRAAERRPVPLLTRTTVGLGLTGMAALLALIVGLSGRPDWWGGPAMFGVLVVLYWSLTSLLFESPAS